MIIGSGNERTEYLLHLADNSLVLGHRNSEWTGHGPILEQDIALSNISLDLIGQARNFYQYAATLMNQSTENAEVNEDTLAYFRNPDSYKNLLLLEQDNGDWGKTIMKQFLYSSFQYFLYRKLINARDLQLAGIAEKSLKEITYHLRWSSEWVIRLGDGTKESNQRMQLAAESLWIYTEEMFLPVEYEKKILAEEGISLQELQPLWIIKVKEIFLEAGLAWPSTVTGMQGGKEGLHTVLLNELLTEMQYLQRTYPGCEW